MIDELRDQGQILIEPFTPAQLQPNGYDVTLGPYHWFPQRCGIDLDRNANYKPWDAESQRGYWAENVTNAMHTGGMIIIPPHTLILGHTNEATGAKWGYVPSLACRSGLARSAVTICACAGFGDDGYTGIWTLEIHNRTDDFVWLPVGVRVGQVVFEQIAYRDTRERRERELSSGYTGSYGQQHRDWTPEDMLPKLPNDPDVRSGLNIIRANEFINAIAR